MKKFISIISILFIYSVNAQVLNGNGVIMKQSTNVQTNVIVEDKSVEAVKEHWNQKRWNDAMNRIHEARAARMSKWIDKPFSLGADLSQYKYMVLLPPRKGHKDIKRNLSKKMKGIPIVYVNTQPPYQTHEKMPPEIKENPDQVLWLTVDARAPYMVETYIQLYDSYGELIYSMGKEAMSASSAFKDFRNELDFVYSF